MRRHDVAGGILVALLATSALAGCAAAGGQRARIREIRADTASSCRFLGSIESTERTGWSMSDDQLGPMKDIRRRAGEMGGNAFVLTHGRAGEFGPAVQADVYRCP